MRSREESFSQCHSCNARKECAGLPQSPLAAHSYSRGDLEDLKQQKRSTLSKVASDFRDPSANISMFPLDLCFPQINTSRGHVLDSVA